MKNPLLFLQMQPFYGPREWQQGRTGDKKGQLMESLLEMEIPRFQNNLKCIIVKKSLKGVILNPQSDLRVVYVLYVLLVKYLLSLSYHLLFLHEAFKINYAIYFLSWKSKPRARFQFFWVKFFRGSFIMFSWILLLYYAVQTGVLCTIVFNVVNSKCIRIENLSHLQQHNSFLLKYLRRFRRSQDQHSLTLWKGLSVWSLGIIIILRYLYL